MPRSKIGIAKGIPEVDAPFRCVIEMIEPQKTPTGQDIHINTQNKVITVHQPTTGQGVFTYVQNEFDAPSMMDYDSPMSMVTPDAYLMTNGWVLANRENFAASLDHDTYARCLGETKESLEISSWCSPACSQHNDWVPIPRNYWPICSNTVEIRTLASDGADSRFALECHEGVVILPVLFIPRTASQGIGIV